MSGGGTSTDYQMPWQQQQILQALLPLVEGTAGFGVGNQTRGPSTTVPGQAAQPFGGYGGYGYGGSSRGRGGGDYGQDYGANPLSGGRLNYEPRPSGFGNFGGGGGYGGGTGGFRGYGVDPQAGTTIPGAVTDLYQQPSAPQPTADWFNNISPDVMKGLWEPYDFAANQMAEQLNYGGSLGAGGSYSGNAMDNFGDFYSKAGTQLGTQAWNMMSPGLRQDYNTQMQELTLPYQLMGMTPSMMPTGIVQNDPNRFGNAVAGGVGGAATGAMAGAAMGAGAGPPGAVIGGIGGLLAGLLA